MIAFCVKCGGQCVEYTGRVRAILPGYVQCIRCGALAPRAKAESALAEAVQSLFGGNVTVTVK
jgi:hypothetical protein